MNRTFNLADLFEIVAAAVPGRIAFVRGTHRLSYQELDQRATRLASGLRQHGVDRGHHVGIQLFNSAQYLETFLACCKIGAAPVNINYRYKAGELGYLFASLDLRALVYGSDFELQVRSALDRAPLLEMLVHVGQTGAAPRSLDYERLVLAGEARLQDPQRSATDTCLLCTGGTTGVPKGVIWPHEALFMAALGGGGIYFGKPPIAAPEELGPLVLSSPPLAYLACAPMMHGAAMWASLISLLAGHCVVVDEQPHFDAAHVWDIVTREGVHIVSVVGDAMALPLIRAIEAEPGRWNLSGLRVFGNGGATFSRHLQDRLRQQLPHLVINNAMGSSETGLVGGDEKPVQGDGFIRIKARPDLALIDEARRIVREPGARGILARTGHTPLGYYGDAKKTAETFVPIDGVVWVLSGDQARIDERGDIVVLGRGSQCINTGGEKVFPEEVEEVVRRCGFVNDVLVIGVPDPRWGQRVTAVVELVPGRTFLREEFQRMCTAHLAGYKLPRTVYLADKVMRSPAGKADYRWAAEHACRSNGVELANF